MPLVLPVGQGAIAVKVVCKEMLQKHHFVMSTMHIALCSRAQGLQAGRLERKRKAAAVQELVALSLSSSFFSWEALVEQLGSSDTYTAHAELMYIIARVDKYLLFNLMWWMIKL